MFYDTPRWCGRAEAPERIDTVSHFFPFRPGAEFLPASSRTLKGDYGLCLRSQGCSTLVTMFKMKKKFPRPSKIYGRLSSITRFVHSPSTLLGVNREQQMVQRTAMYEQGCKLIVSVPAHVTER